MKKIGNIVYDKELMNHQKVDWLNYVQKNEVCDYNLPTLIVGWNNFKNKFPHLHPNILNKKINSTYPRVCWEFSMDEKITEHFTGIENFVKNAPREFINQYKYYSIDPIANNILNPEHLYRSMGISSGSYYQYKDEIIYVKNGLNSNIIGIYLNAFKYFGFDITEIMTFFAENFTSKTIDADGSIYLTYYKQFPEFDQLKRSMVLFLD